ncbi:hypothetical protein HHK36_022298 [Tetracentron sinense]|uniref:Nuclease HARBI1 n=1 Tax=Tetracentron sinense TaxID=13715 RepID=A0A834YSN0_TETSI|nr:hypothetical protein HHK36_022298 [Tetracentron sinense]
MLVVVVVQQKQSNAERRTRLRLGSIQGHSTIRRDRVQGHERLYNDYFAENPMYSSIQFRRRFRMSRLLFLRIQSAMEAHDPCFILKEMQLEPLVYHLFKRFVRVVVEVFGEEYLRSPNNDDISRLLAQGEARGFPGMLGSIDCMHWKWKNCPIAWKGQYERGGHHDPSIIFEAVALYDLWI